MKSVSMVFLAFLAVIAFITSLTSATAFPSSKNLTEESNWGQHTGATLPYYVHQSSKTNVGYGYGSPTTAALVEVEVIDPCEICLKYMNETDCAAKEVTFCKYYMKNYPCSNTTHLDFIGSSTEKSPQHTGSYLMAAQGGTKPTEARSANKFSTGKAFTAWKDWSWKGSDSHSDSHSMTGSGPPDVTSTIHNTSTIEITARDITYGPKSTGTNELSWTGGKSMPTKLSSRTSSHDKVNPGHTHGPIAISATVARDYSNKLNGTDTSGMPFWTDGTGAIHSHSSHMTTDMPTTLVTSKSTICSEELTRATTITFSGIEIPAPSGIAALCNLANLTDGKADLPFGAGQYWPQIEAEYCDDV